MSILLRRAMMMASSIIKHIISSVTGLVSFSTNVAADMPSVLCEFAPVQTGSGDPAPDNVRPISGWTGLTVTRAGKNLLALPIVPYKSVNPYGGNTNFNPADYFWVKAGTYTLSYIGNESNRWCIKIFDRDGNALSDSAHQITNAYFNTSYKGWLRNGNAAAGATSQTFTLVEDCYLRICRTFTYPGTVDTVEFTDCQLEVSSSATAYEMYSGTSVTVSWQSEAGAVYGGTLNVATGLLTVTIVYGEYTKVTGFSTGSYSAYAYTPGSVRIDKFADGINVADYLKTYNGNSNTASMPDFSMAHRGGAATVFGIRLDSTYASKADYDAYLSAHPLHVALKLETPQTYQLTPAQVQSIIGTNNVWHNANGGITVEYYNKY